MFVNLEIASIAGIRKYMKYGTISEKSLGPNEWPAHQWGKDDITIQCKTIILRASNTMNNLPNDSNIF